MAARQSLYRATIATGVQIPGPQSCPLMADPKNSSQTWRLRKHADYQRVYREGRRQSLPLLTYFFAARTIASGQNAAAPGHDAEAPRVGLTTGRVLGKAVERNRIKRRMRAVVRAQIHLLQGPIDVVLHPRRQVLEAEFAAIERDVTRAFAAVMRGLASAEAHGETIAAAPPQPRRPERRPDHRPERRPHADKR